MLNNERIYQVRFYLYIVLSIPIFLAATTSLTSSTRRGELGSNGTLLSSRTESHIVPHLNKVGEPEKFIPPSFSSSANEDVFGNVVGARSIAATTTTQMNSSKYDIHFI